MADRRILIVIEGRDNASGALRGVGGALGNIGQIAAGILTAGLFERLASSVINLGVQGLQAVGNYERLGQTLQTLAARELLNTGQATEMSQALEMSSGKAKELLGWVQQLAIKSPFTSQGVADAFRTAMAYGFTTDEAKRLTSAMINFAAGSGATEDSMGRIALALGQIQAKGKLSGQEVLQLVNAGLPVTQILAKAFGKTTAEIQRMQEAGLIPAKDAIEAIVNTLETDFAGAAERQSLSWAGLLSTFQDLKEVGLREFFTGLAQAIQPVAIEFSEWLQGPGLIMLKDWGNQLGIFASAVAGVAGAILDAGLFSTEFFDSLGGFERFFVVFEDGSSHLSKFFELLGMSEEKSQSFAASILNGVGTAIQTVQGIIDQFRPGLELLGMFWLANGPAITEAIQSAFGRAGVILSDLGSQILPFLVEQFNKISAWFAMNGPLIQEFVTMAGMQFSFLIEILASAWQVISPLLGGIVDLILGIAKFIMQLATRDWPGAWETINSVMEGIGNTLAATIMGFLNFIAELMGTNLNDLVTMWSNIWDMFIVIVTAYWDHIVETVQEKIASVADAFGGIIDAISSAIDWVRRLAASFASLTIPDWLTPGSPTPFELGLVGINKAMGQLADKTMPTFSGGFGNMPALNPAGNPALAGLGVGQTGGAVVIQLTYSPMFSMADEHEFSTRIVPFIEKAIRERGL